MKKIDFDFDNVGGLAHLYLIDASALLRCDVNVKNGYVRPVIASENMIYDIAVYAGDNFAFTENLLEEDTGEVYDVAISGFIPKMDNIMTVAEMERKEWIAVHQDANGNLLISGTKEMPLRFITNKTTGTAPTRNATAFTLVGKLTCPSKACDSWVLSSN